MIHPGDIIPGNMYFTTTRLHQELAGGTFVDVIIDEAHDPANPHPFKGNVDLAKLQRVIEDAGAGKIPYVCIAGTVNMAGGQPQSMENMRAVRELADNTIFPWCLTPRAPLRTPTSFSSASRDTSPKSVAEILKEYCSYTDTCTMSAKKDALVNIGGWLATNDQGLYEEARNLVVVYEGLHTYGGLAGRDMEAMARGIVESVEDDHIRTRIGQVEYLGNHLIDWGIPIVKPIGGHAVFLDAKAFYPHIPQSQYPAQALACDIYIDSGVRTMERGAVSAGRDAKTGEEHFPKLELVRITIPRRVYTQAHMDVVAESVLEVYEQREMARGLRMTFEPKYLRFFQARFERAA